MKKLLLSLILTMSAATTAQAAGGGGCGMNPATQEPYECSTAPVRLTDKASLQRGAAVFMNYCAGCHSLKYLRYERMATDLAIPNELVEKYMMFTTDKIGDGITAKIDPKMQAKWFGNAPPDLSLTARLRSPDWIYTFLLTFYEDPNRPWGVNNITFKDVAMPHVLHNLQQDLGDDEYRERVGDLTNFLTYAAEPIAHQRKIYGFFVILFLLVLLIPVWLLNKEYWKDVK